MKAPDITPGPWNFDPDQLKAYGTSTIYNGEDQPITLGCSKLPRAQNMANAQAIAALPDLLEALEKSHEWTKALYAALPFDKGQEAMRSHSDQLKLVQSALLKAGYAF